MNLKNKRVIVETDLKGKAFRVLFFGGLIAVYTEYKSFL